MYDISLVGVIHLQQVTDNNKIVSEQTELLYEKNL